jgi:hypothetical protein
MNLNKPEEKKRRSARGAAYNVENKETKHRSTQDPYDELHDIEKKEKKKSIQNTYVALLVKIRQPSCLEERQLLW